MPSYAFIHFKILTLSQEFKYQASIAVNSMLTANRESNC